MPLVMLAPWLAGMAWPAAASLSLLAVPAALPLVRWADAELLRIHWQSDGRWLFVDHAGRKHEAQRLSRGIFISASLVALHWRCDTCRRKFRAALLDDNCDAEARRNMQVRLRLSGDEELFGGALNSANE